MPWDQFVGTDQDPADLRTILLNLALVLALGQLLAWHYLRFSPVLSNKRKFARMFVFLSATTMLVISVVQTSLALSLGLVGALSIIRFRTPIKEPEELAYLFLAIGLGLGMGANQRVVTCLIFVVILTYMGIVSSRGPSLLPPRLLVHVSGELLSANGAESTLKAILARAGEGATRVDLRRVDAEGTSFQATLVVDLKGADGVGALLTRVREALPGSTVSMVEGSSLD